MDNPQLIAFLSRQVGLCKYFSDEYLEQLVSGSRIVTYEPNEAVIEFGETADFLGILVQGVLAVSVPADGGRSQVIGHFKAGDTFGEMALMSGEKTLADFIAETQCQVLRIPVTVFQSAIMTNPRAMQHVSKTITDRFRQLTADPDKAAAAFRQSEDPYGLRLQGERPEKILVICNGSTSLRYAFFDTANESNTLRGEIKREPMQKDMAKAFEVMLRELTAPGAGAIGQVSEISVVGHRVVHGGRRFSEAVLIDEQVLDEIEAMNPLAPLHNPFNAAGIREAMRLFPSVPHAAVFDTAFHHTLPSYAYLYGLPYEYFEKRGLRRYGFHGSSHSYAALRAAQHLQRRVNELEIVTCHLGRGVSLCAVDHGRSVDTSMGLTPAEGLIMDTRCGDLDPGAIFYLKRQTGLDDAQVEDILNQRSGLLGLSGISGDMQQIERAADAGDPRALVAMKVFCYRLRKYIGAYLAAMGGLDVLVFTGGIGQGSAGIRSLALQGLECMGIRLDEERNRQACGFDEVCRISMDDSHVIVLVVPADEERMIARETLRTVSRSYLTGVLEVQKTEPFLLEVSAHHIHLSQDHVEALFGRGHQLTCHSDLSQPGQFACTEQVAIVGPKGRIERVRVLGPARKASQVEIAMTEQFKLGIHPPIRESGDLRDTPGCTLEGPAGRVTLDQGVICALRHIHMTPADALRYGVKDKSTVRVRVLGDRELVFGDVCVRVNPNFKLAMHIDTDEANAANLKTGAQVYIAGIQSED
jgi:acetate kinase